VVFLSKKPTFYSLTVTVGDTNTQLTTDEGLIFETCNIHCYTNDVYYGNAVVMGTIIRADAIIWFDKPVKASEVFFKNVNAGSAGVIYITGIIRDV